MKKRIRLLSVVLVFVALSLFSSELWSASVRGFRQMTSGSPKESTENVDQSQKISRPLLKKGRSLRVKQDDVHQGKVMVKFTEEASIKVISKIGKSGVMKTRSASSRLRVGVSSIDARLEPMKATEIKRVFPYHPKYEARQRAKGLHLWYEIQIDTTAQVATICRELELDDNIQLAEPVLKKVFKDIQGKKNREEGKVDQTTQTIVMPLTGGFSSQLSTRASRIPLSSSARGYEENPPVNDPMLLQQWHYYNYGQVVTSGGMASTPGADIKLFDAWKINMGDPRVIVSVHDEGVQVDHPDIAANMWVNQAELNGRPGVDDDNNGYIDDINGFNFVNNVGRIIAGDHGSHTAATISGVNNNGIGIAGIAGGSGKGDGVRLMACQNFLGDNSTNSAASYVYAANNGAIVSQNSWGHTKPGLYEQTVLDAIDYFIEYAGKDENGNPLPNTPMVGGIVIFAAGNDGTDDVWYPGYYDACLTVASIGPWYNKPSYTNFGKWVDIAAPGGSISDNGIAGAGVLSAIADSKYDFMQGTSMACPHVSGVAALVLSEYGHKAYTPAMLRNRILSSVTSWSEIGKNEYTSTMGVGLLNAAKAMAPDKGIAPESITNLKIESIGYEFVRVTFTAPRDEDNVKATSYEVRYSADSITEGNFSEGVALFQIALDAGRQEEIVIDRLKGFTSYQIAVKSVDIWGNVSKISNIIEVTTKSAPEIKVSPDSLELELADAIRTSGEGWLEIGNAKGGDLRYSLNYAIQEEPNTNVGQFTDFIYNYKTDGQYPPGNMGSNGEERFLAASRFQVNKKKGFVLTNVVAAIYPLGTDGKIVAYMGEYFNLKVYTGGKTPAEGKLLHNAQYRVSFKDFILLGGGADLNYQLAGAYRFEEGEHFWVVFDFPKGYVNPMKVHGGTPSLLGNELYSVNDTTWTDINTIKIGNLQPNLAYRIFSLSNQNSLPANLVTLTPKEGFVRAGETERIKVNVNAQKVVEGNYKSMLFISHNDPEQSVIQVPLRFTVDGHYSGISSAKTVSFGDVVQGFSDTTSLIVRNDSLGLLKIDTIICDKKQFTVTPSGSISIKPGKSVLLRLKFTAPGMLPDGTSPKDSVGVFMSKLNFKTNTVSGNYSVIMDAVSIERPIAKLSKTTETIELKMRETKEVEFTLKNEGKYRLDYRVEEDKTTDFDFHDVIPKVNQYYGKLEHVTRWTNLNASDKKVLNITDKLRGLRNFPVALPFSFTYYGVVYDTITIVSDGTIRMGNHKEYAGNPSIVGRWAIPSTIFPCYTNAKARTTDVEGQVLLKVEGGQVSIEYTKFGTAEAAGEAETIRIQTVLYADGKIELKYKDFAEKPRKTGLNIGGLIGMSDNTPYGGLGIWLCREDDRRPGYFYAGSTYLYGSEESMIIQQGDRRDTVYYRWTPPVIEYKKNTVITITPEVVFVKDIASSEGHLMPGEEVNIRVSLGTDKNLKEGRYVRTIPIFTNDPENKEIGFKLNIDFKSDALPVFAQTELNFGKVGKNVTATASVPLRNMGGKPFKATATLATGQFFKVLPVGEKECAGLSSMEYDIEFTPTEEKVYEDRLVIEIENGAPLTLNIKGEGIKAPRLEVEKKADVFKFSADRTVEGVHYTDTSIIVRNIGEAPLNYNVMTSEWIHDLSPSLMSGMDETGYFWSDNLDDKSGVQYEWIEKNPIPFDPLNRIDGKIYFSKEFELPWDFEFYGEKFRKCYINLSGMVYFNRNDIIYHPMLVNAIEAPDLQIPHEGLVNGFIAALGGSFDRSKHWYEIVGEGDNAKIVFTWHSRPLFNVQLAQDTNFVTFQTILHKDGSIKFQYKDVEKAWWRNRTVIGIENRQGTDGLNVCSNETKYIRNGLAIFIKPSQMKTLKPGEERKLRLRADASNLWEKNATDRFGETVEPHKGVVLVRSNDPLTHQNITQIEMSVKGEVRLEYTIDGMTTKEIGFGEVLRSIYPKSHDPKDHSYLYDEKKYTKVIAVKNIGTKAVDIHSEKQNILNKPYLSDDVFAYDIRSSTATYINVQPQQSFQWELSIKPLYANVLKPEQNAPGVGQHRIFYPITQKCGFKDSVKCRELGYPYHALGLVMGRPGYSHSYKVDTLYAVFDIYDVPQEEVVAERLTQNIVYDSRQGSRDFTFDIRNNKIEEPDFWNKMHGFIGDNNKPKIEQQINLNYSIELENLTKVEFERLLKKQVSIPQHVIAAERVSQEAVKLNEIIAPMATLAKAALTDGDGTAGFLDSLGYFEYEKRGSGYSGSSKKPFTSYIRYKAGATGFNLTHFTMYMAKIKNYPEEGYGVKVKVLQGQDARTADVIHTEEFIPEIPNFSEFTFVKYCLEKSVYIYPGEYFWIAIENKPNTAVQTILWAGSKNYPNSLRDNFMIELGDLFGYAVDLTNQLMGWSIVAWSDEQVGAVEDWITVSTDKGSIPVGTKEQITVTVNPEFDRTEMITRYARIRVQSNDPYPFGVDSTLWSEFNFTNKVAGADSVNFKAYARNRNEILVMMRMNQAPEFSMESQAITLAEKQDSTIMVYVRDIEGDSFDDLQAVLDSSVFVEPAYGIVPETSLKKAEAKGDTTCFTFTVKPGYESEGVHVYTFTTKDAKGNVSKHSITVTVVNTNRAPEMTGANAVILKKEILKNINLNTLFNDLDRDELTYSVEVLNSDIATANVLDSTMTLFGWQIGEAQLKVTATDPEGAVKNAIFQLSIIDEDPSNRSIEVSIYPNPVVEIMNCAFSLSKRSTVQFRIFNTDGRMFYESDKQGYAIGKHEAKIKVNHLPGGMFILQYIVDGAVKDTQKFIK